MGGYWSGWPPPAGERPLLGGTALSTHTVHTGAGLGFSAGLGAYCVHTTSCTPYSVMWNVEWGRSNHPLI